MNISDPDFDTAWDDGNPYVDPAVIKAEKYYRTQKAKTARKNSVDPEYRRRLHAAGLGDVLNSFIRKGE